MAHNSSSFSVFGEAPARATSELNLQLDRQFSRSRQDNYGDEIFNLSSPAGWQSRHFGTSL